MNDELLIHMALDFCRYLSDTKRSTGMTDDEKRLADNAAQKLAQYLNNQRRQ